MDLVIKTKYKSLSNITWNQIPNFVVITGKNGTGKSHLLEFFQERTHYSHNYIQNINHKYEDIVYIKGEWLLKDLNRVSLNDIQAERNNFFTRFIQHLNNYRNNLSRESFANAKQKASNTLQYSNINKYFDKVIDQNQQLLTTQNPNDFRETFLEQLPNDIITSLQESVSNNRIGNIFYNYYLDLTEAKLDNIPEEKLIEKECKAPWRIINQLFEDMNLPLLINNPTENNIRDSYHPTLTNTISKDIVKFSELSSGEKTLVTLVLWLFNSNKNQAFPKLLLLDEPDAHLHPSMTKKLIQVLKNTLCDKYEVRVIMTTHSPSTVALAPEESLFEMTLGDPRIRKVDDREKVISMLTDGLILVSKNTKYVLVEGKNDQPFYEENFQLMLHQNLINNDIPLGFISGTNKDSVNHWAKGLRNAGLSELFKGLIDKDYDNEISDGIFRLNRYSIENYLLDPIIIFSIARQLPVSLKSFNYKISQEYRIKSFDQQELQTIANEILKEVENELTNLSTEDKQITEISYMNGKSIKVPKWLLLKRGKDLLPIFQNKFGGGRIINNKNLTENYTRVGFIPNDLVDLFKELQK